MKKVSKKRKVINQKMNLSKKYDPKEAIKLIKDNSYVNFNESLDIAIKLSIDTSKTDQNIRGVINLPHGTGKKIRVAVMAKDEKAKEAKEAGADIVGDNDLSENIQKGNEGLGAAGSPGGLSGSRGGRDSLFDVSLIIVHRYFTYVNYNLSVI